MALPYENSTAGDKAIPFGAPKTGAGPAVSAARRTDMPLSCYCDYDPEPGDD